MILDSLKFYTKPFELYECFGHASFKATNREPRYELQVLGRGAAERAGLKVGDMVYAINQKYINTYSHKDAQNVILHTGDTLVLNIRR